MYTLTPRHAPTAELMAEYFTFVPNTRDLRNFEMDMRSLHPELFRGAIRECIATAKQRPIPYREQRAEIHKVYVRKVKEFAAIYPLIFAVENSIRSALADHLEQHFGEMCWWTLFRDQVKKGGSIAHFQQNGNGGSSGNIRGRTVKMDFIRIMFRIMEQLLNNTKHAPLIMGTNKTDEFYYCLSLRELWQITSNGWSFTRPMFCPDKHLPSPLTKKIFDDEMRVLTASRNKLFHSNPIPNRAVVTQCAEKLLNYVDFHFGDYDIALSQAQYTRPPPTITRTLRHALPG